MRGGPVSPQPVGDALQALQQLGGGAVVVLDRERRIVVDLAATVRAAVQPVAAL